MLADGKRIVTKRSGRIRLNRAWLSSGACLPMTTTTTSQPRQYDCSVPSHSEPNNSINAEPGAPAGTGMTSPDAAAAAAAAADADAGGDGRNPRGAHQIFIVLESSPDLSVPVRRRVN